MSTPSTAPDWHAIRAVVARVVARLVAEEVPVYGAVPEPPSLEDVYFDIQARLAADPEWQLV